MALYPNLQARAKEIVIKPADLPRGWLVDTSWNSKLTATEGPVWHCSGYAADLSALTVHGAWSEEVKVPVPSGGLWQITSGLFFMASAKQARELFDVGRGFYPKYCAIVGTVQGGSRLVSLTRVSLPRVADQQVGFRAFSVGQRKGWGDLILLRKGDVCADLVFQRPGSAFPKALEDTIIRKFAARLHP